MKGDVSQSHQVIGGSGVIRVASYTSSQAEISVDRIRESLELAS